MKLIKILILTISIQLCISASVQAGDFSWLDNLSIEARADSSGVKTMISGRFNIGEAEVSAVIGDVGGHADAYMVLRLAELSHQPIDTVIRHYHTSKKKGWGALAKRLGINPGSREFHALKRGHDLNRKNSSYDNNWKSNGKGKGKGKGNNKGKGQGKGNK